MSDTTTTETTTYDMSSPGDSGSTLHCAACGSDPEQAHRIRDLEAELRLLKDKASAAVFKLADYEEEIRHLKAARHDSPVEESLQIPDSKPQRPPLDRKSSTGGRFTFLSSRKQSTTPPPNSTSRGSTADLEAALARETLLRQQAEKKATDTENEIEDLSATLFEQANEMVSTERREKAQLEEKVVMLEQREKERTRRLDRIDEAMKRLERVKALLSAPP